MMIRSIEHPKHADEFGRCKGRSMTNAVIRRLTARAAARDACTMGSNNSEVIHDAIVIGGGVVGCAVLRAGAGA